MSHIPKCPGPPGPRALAAPPSSPPGLHASGARPAPARPARPLRSAPPRIAAAGLQLRRSGAAAACRRTPPHRCFGPGLVGSSSARVFGPWVGRHRGAVYSNRCGGPRGSAAAAARVNRAPGPRPLAMPVDPAAPLLRVLRLGGRRADSTCARHGPPGPRARAAPLASSSGPARARRRLSPLCAPGPARPCPPAPCAPHPPRLSVAATDKGGTARRTRRRRALLRGARPLEKC
jgi:hypothetical protein